MLVEKANAMLSSEVNVVNHIAGLRPTVKDRRPLIGELVSNLYSFNGMGTRGVLIAPLLVVEFFGYLEGRNELHPETDLVRFR